MVRFVECFVCKRNAELEKVDNMYICEKCFEKFALMYAASEGIDIWIQQTIAFRSEYDVCIDEIIKGYVAEIEKKSVCITEQEQELLNKIREEVEVRLCFYRKDELFLAFFAIKEYIRRYLLVASKPDWIYIGDIATINSMMKTLNNISQFENSPITRLENGCCNLANAICWTRRYVLVKDNISILTKKEHCLNDVWYEAVQYNDTEKYFDEYLQNGKGEKQEDYVIQNEVLKSRLEAEKKTPEKILENIDNLLFKEFGIKKQWLNTLSSSFFKMEFPDEKNYRKWIRGGNLINKQMPVFLIEKKEITDIIGEDMFDNILNLFSINRNINKNEIFLELFCFYEVNDNIVFGNIDLVQTVSIFEKLLLSGHFLGVFKKNLSSNKIFVQAQRTLSKYFSYCVADLLFSNGYELPMEMYKGNMCIRAEIEHIIVNGENILVDREKASLGDIDVLALNSKKKEILLFELKYYRPALDYKEMFLRDKNIIVDKEVIRHIKARESAIAINTNAVVKFIKGKEESGYSVKSILLTPRTNYYGICQEEVEYLTWDQLLKSVKKMDL